MVNSIFIYSCFITLLLEVVQKKNQAALLSTLRDVRKFLLFGQKDHGSDAEGVPVVCYPGLCCPLGERIAYLNKNNLAILE
jgi:hypothetical protein